MPHPNPYPLCVVCGAKADSHEHAIPAWIAKQFGLKHVEMHEIEVVGAIRRRNQPIRVSSYRARVFCKSCNAHFKHLEDAVIPYLVPMGKGRSLALGIEAQQLIALWAAKTTVAITAASSLKVDEVVPVAHRLAIREKSLVPDDCWIGYCPFFGTSHVWAGSGSVTDEGVDPPIRYTSYGVVLTFAHLGFKVDCYSARFPRHILSGDRPSLEQVWPKKTDMLIWPPKGTPLTNDDLRRLIDFYPVERLDIIDG